MTPEHYESFRNELVDIIQKTAALDSVPVEKKRVLERVSKKALENQFEIVLAGEFQGGKSTTFNIFCDGRELSPRGSGVKTSGCIVIAQNIASPNEPESAIVEWKDSKQLISGFSDLLGYHLKNIDACKNYFLHLQAMKENHFTSNDTLRFENALPEAIESILDLSQPEHRQWISKALEEEWRIWKQCRSRYDPNNTGKLDILRMASLVTFFYDSDEIAQFKKKTRFDPETVGSMITFPSDWEERWTDGDPSAFYPSEIVFVFIHSITIRIHSTNLGRIGCVIIDCPGLFASRWDTDIARSAMVSADTILYLFDGSRTLKQSDLKSLSFIQDNGMIYKTLYGCNIRGMSLENSRRIIQSSIDQLNRLGFLTASQDIFAFHALLALLVVQTETYQYLSNCIQEINRLLQILKIENLKEDHAREDVICLARQVSGLNDLIKTVEYRVIQKKAKTILIDHGALLVDKVLLEAERIHILREQAALKQEKELYYQLEAVEIELKIFKDRCFLIISQLDDQSPDVTLADDICYRIHAAKEALLEKVSDRIYHQILSFREIGSLLNHQKLSDKIAGIIYETFDIWLKSIMTQWIGEIRDGRNSVWNRVFTKMICSVVNDINHVWNSSGLSKDHWLQEISIPEFSGNLSIDQEKLFLEVSDSQLLENIKYHAIITGAAGFFSATSGMITAAVTVMTKMMRVIFTSVIFVMVNLVFLFFTKGIIESMLKEDIKKKLSLVFPKLFQEIEEQVKKEVMKFSATIRLMYKNLMSEAVEKPRHLFEMRKKEAEEIFQKGRKDRLKIASQSKTIREAEIVPLRHRVEDFIKRVHLVLIPESSDHHHG